ncbi:ribbon-helix-helix domain-containing protein [Glacieibacterium megasporae]|uniref:ribbon-helix-helix domain-containing protein n=1 Tax=Glacieibacterium megasporae TaxID=2835787 RepID=UPI001C1E5089|nr:type II toxin-antitoxin system ParD family antitoxin [Polymorphobacter megasporae]UAJ09861.1 type II toxin-antitoxin system ParD family antitoxin [Polymorphobacter megasporae]
MATQEFIITLPNELAEKVRNKVATGEYDSPGDVILDGLEVLMGPDLRVERWLREKVVPACEAWQADPTHVYTSEEVLAHIAERHAVADRT